MVKKVPLVCESMRHLDIIFFLPITKAAPVKIEEDGMRETDPVYIKEIDNIFKMIGAQHYQNNGKNPFFPKDDAPGWIEIFGKPAVRIAMIKQYLDVDGDLIGGTEESMNELINPHDGKFIDKDTQTMQDLIDEQRQAMNFEKELKHQKEQIKNMLGDKDIDEIHDLYNKGRKFE